MLYVLTYFSVCGVVVGMQDISTVVVQLLMPTDRSTHLRCESTCHLFLYINIQRLAKARSNCSQKIMEKITFHTSPNLE